MGAVTKGLTNCAPQVKEEPGTGSFLVLQLVLIAVPLDALCFLCSTCFFAGMEFWIP